MRELHECEACSGNVAEGKRCWACGLQGPAGQGLPIKPGAVIVHEIGVLTDAFGNAEVEMAGALVVFYHVGKGLEDWQPVTRRQVIEFVEERAAAEDATVLRWVGNPFWRPNPNRLRDEGWITGWTNPDDPGAFTEKALHALANRGAWKQTREVG